MEAITAFIERTLPQLSLEQLSELRDRVIDRQYALDLARYGRHIAEGMASLEGRPLAQILRAEGRL